MELVFPADFRWDVRLQSELNVMRIIICIYSQTSIKMLLNILEIVVNVEIKELFK